MSDDPLTPREILHNARLIDIYTGRIAVKQGNHWQWAYIGAGYCAVADWATPNQHVGILKIEDALDEDAWRKPLQPIEGNIVVLWGGFVDGETVEKIEQSVRIGRTKRVQGGTIVIDGPGAFDHDSYIPEPHEADWDETNFPFPKRR